MVSTYAWTKISVKLLHSSFLFMDGNSNVKSPNYFHQAQFRGFVGMLSLARNHQFRKTDPPILYARNSKEKGGLWLGKSWCSNRYIFITIHQNYPYFDLDQYNFQLTMSNQYQFLSAPQIRRVCRNLGQFLIHFVRVN